MKQVNQTIADAIAPFLQPVKIEDIFETNPVENIKTIAEISKGLINDRKLLTNCLKRVLELVENMTPKSTAEVIVDDVIDTINKLS